MRLSSAAVRNAQPGDRPTKLSDGGGLYLLVNPTGSKLWRYDFRLAGLRKTMALGIYPAVGLAEARARHQVARETVAAGSDPTKPAPVVAVRSFQTVAEEWLVTKRTVLSEKYAKRVERRLTADVYPAIGGAEIGSVTRADMVDLLRLIEKRGTIEGAHRTRNICSEVFQFAEASGYRDSGDPAAGLLRALKRKPPVEHRAALKASDMGGFLVRLSHEDLEPVTRDAMLFTLLTVVRTNEARFATCVEFEGLDGDSPLWRIPAARMKMNREHQVPLSRQAAVIARRLVAARRGQGMLFARGTKSGTLSENTMLYAMYRLGYHSKATVHGFRGTFSTLANEEGWNRDWIERQLAHVEGSDVRGAYNSAQYMTGRRKLLQWWADWLDQQEELERLVG